MNFIINIDRLIKKYTDDLRRIKVKKEFKVSIDGKTVSIDLPDKYNGNDLIMAMSVIFDKVPIQYRKKVIKELVIMSREYIGLNEILSCKLLS